MILRSEGQVIPGQRKTVADPGSVGVSDARRQSWGIEPAQRAEGAPPMTRLSQAKTVLRRAG